MALNGSFTGSTANSYITPKIVWSAEQSISGNWSKVTATLSYSKSSSTSQATSGTWSGGITIDGTETTGTKSGVAFNPGGGYVSVLTATTYVYHGTDGKKSFAISAYGKVTANGVNTSLSSTTISKTGIELDQIPRKSIATLTKSSVDFGKSVGIATNRASSDFTHKLYYRTADSNWIAITETASVLDTYSWVVPKSLMEKIPEASSLTITISCDTYYKGAYMAEHHMTLTATVPADDEDCYPTIGGISWTKAEDSKEPSGWPLIQGVSKGTLEMTDLAGAYGSRIYTYSLTFAGLSSTYYTLKVDNLASAGKLKAIAKVTDTRGRATTKEVEFDVAAYSPPNLTTNVYRCDSEGNESVSGDYLRVLATASVSQVKVNGTNQNTLQSLTLYYKKSTDTSYSNKSLTSGTALILSASSNNTWDWYITASDKINTVRSDGAAPTGDVVFDILANGKGIAFGKVAEMEGFDSAWPYMLNGKAQGDYIVEQGTSTSSSDSTTGAKGGTWTYRKWNSGWAECWCDFWFGSQAITTAWGYLYETAAANIVSFPENLFTSTPATWPQVIYTNGGSILALEIQGENSTSKSIGWYPVRPTPQTVSYWCQVYARGKWK